MLGAGRFVNGRIAIDSNPKAKAKYNENYNLCGSDPGLYRLDILATVLGEAVINSNPIINSTWCLENIEVAGENSGLRITILRNHHLGCLSASALGPGLKIPEMETHIQTFFLKFGWERGRDCLSSRWGNVAL